MGNDDRLTPARRQYLALKRRHPDALLLYRMGDFYELFDDDAVVAARDLHITLTSREFGKGNRVPMAGVPHHALASYLRRLLARGHRVAIGEQLSEPGHGLVERDVVRVLSPGTVVEPGLLAARENNYLVALNPGRDGTGLAYVDVSTGEFGVTEFAPDGEAALAAELGRLAPAECLAPEGRGPAPTPSPRPLRVSANAGGGEPLSPSPPRGGGGGEGTVPTALACPLTVCPARWFQERPARERLLRHFGVASLEPFGCEGLSLGIGAAGAVLAYVEGTNRDLLRLLRGLRTYSTDAYVALDPHTRRNLELTRSARSGERAGSLLAALDHTRTAMGGRLLRRWLNRPLRDVAAINRRLDVVEALAAVADRRAALLAALERTGDLERLAGRARQGIANPRDLLALAAGLRAAAEIATLLAVDPSSPASSQPYPPIPSPRGGGGDPRLPFKEGMPGGVGLLATRLDPAPDVTDLIERAVTDQDGRIIRQGFDPELDELAATVGTAQQTLLDLERRERERTGIRSLKVGFNKVFGYYIEVSRPNLRAVPADYLRRQTLANGERFVTPELKEWEARILRAEERINGREQQVFAAVMEAAGAQVDRLLATAAALAELDVLATFAELAVRRRYVRPALDGATAIAIAGGRHPVVELALEEGAFVANDTFVGGALTPQPPLPRAGEGENGSHPPGLGEGVGAGTGGPGRLLLITGPNMAGKSTYLRQVALIVLLAHVGCFVPAERAAIGLVDRIFTRVGAQDDLAAGASTFLVEMIETAAILRHATDRSLLIFDEIGRGTSTFDGLSIAQAVVEDVHDRIRARTLFATHFHELTALAERLPGMRNYNVAAVEEAGRVVFLRRVVPGGADRSYGIHVARLAGLPQHVTTRAEALLAEMETGAYADGPHPSPDRSRLRPTGQPMLGEGAGTTSVYRETPDNAGVLPSPRIGGGAGGGGLPSPKMRADTQRPGAGGGGQQRGCLACALERQAALLDELRALNLAATTPIQALNFLFALQEQLGADVQCTCAGNRARLRLAVLDPPGTAAGGTGGRPPRAGRPRSVSAQGYEGSPYPSTSNH